MLLSPDAAASSLQLSWKHGVSVIWAPSPDIHRMQEAGGWPGIRGWEVPWERRQEAGGRRQEAGGRRQEPEVEVEPRTIFHHLKTLTFHLQRGGGGTVTADKVDAMGVHKNGALFCK